MSSMTQPRAPGVPAITFRGETHASSGRKSNRAGDGARPCGRGLRQRRRRRRRRGRETRRTAAPPRRHRRIVGDVTAGSRRRRRQPRAAPTGGLRRSTDRRSAQGHDGHHARTPPGRPTRTSPTPPRLYAKYINARGGIAGRPLEVTVCDEQFDPAVATTCARQAVEDEAWSRSSARSRSSPRAIVPVIAESNITWFGECCPITPSELTSPYSFNIGNQPMYAVGAVKQAVEDGCKNINAVIIDGAQIFIPPMENAMKALGMTFGDEIILPPTAQDYSAEVAQATTRRRLRDRHHLRDAVHHVEHRVDAVGYRRPSSTDRRATSTRSRRRAPRRPPTATSSPACTPTSPPPRGTSTATRSRPGSTRPSSTTTASVAWARGRRSSGSPRSPRRSTVTSRPSRSTTRRTRRRKLDLNGMVPVLDFTKEWTDGLEGYNRLFNRSVVFSKLENGKVVPLTTEFEDVSDLATRQGRRLIVRRATRAGSTSLARAGSLRRDRRGRRPSTGRASPSCRACRPG